MGKKKEPNKETIEAMKDSEEGKNLTKCNTVEELKKELDRPE